MKNTLIIGIISIAVIAGGWNLISNSPSVSQVGGKAFVEGAQQTSGAVILDVRTPEEFAAGHLAGAQNVDFEALTFTSEIQKLNRTVPYFVYCRSGNRSGQAIKIMTENGFKSITELRGGIVSNQTSIQLIVTSQEEYVVDPSDLLSDMPVEKASSPSKLSDKEIAGLVQMREEEKLAHDVYTALGAHWSAPVFANIAGSELTHTTAVKTLLSRYGIADPAGSTAEGVFQSTDLQKLYTSLVAQGKKSLKDALIVGATIEDLDIRDLDVLMKETDKADILTTYANLQKGSRNHLRGFMRNITMSSGSYTPQYISQDAFDGILAAPQERGNRI